tara:strand:- start:332 stop:538 length:207 start_codon:yes stop_codon:yes gene_type:complete
MGNKIENFGNGNMVWTIIYRDYNGKHNSKVVYGPPDKTSMLSAVKEEYKRLIALMPGNQKVTLAPEKP